MKKKRIIINRIVWGFMLLVSILLVFIIPKGDILDNADWYLLFLLDIYLIIPTCIVMFIASLTLSYKGYRYNDNKISVYAGFFHHQLKVNDELCDERAFSYSPIYLNTELDDGSFVEVIISGFNKVTLKINNKLIKPQRKNVYEK